MKLRDVEPVEFEKGHVKLMILRAEADQDWDRIDYEIWVNFSTVFDRDLLLFSPQNHFTVIFFKSEKKSK